MIISEKHSQGADRMKYIILTLAISALPLLSFAETYSCRDNEGQLHIADNLMKLPEECRYQANTLDPKATGKVNYVPAGGQTHQINNDFERAVRQEQQEVKRHEQEAQNIISQAKWLAESYENAVIKRKTALRSKKYGFREEIIEADKDMKRAIKDKKTLLQEVEKVRISTTQREQIEMFMNKIPD